MWWTMQSEELSLAVFFHRFVVSVLSAALLQGLLHGQRVTVHNSKSD